MQAINVTKSMVVAQTVSVADTFLTRLKGLLGTKEFLLGQGLLIKPCNSVHTFGMRYPIDVVFIGAGHVLKVVNGMPPGRVSACVGGDCVLELPVGVVLQTETSVGDKVEFK